MPGRPPSSRLVLGGLVAAVVLTACNLLGDEATTTVPSPPTSSPAASTTLPSAPTTTVQPSSSATTTLGEEGSLDGGSLGDVGPLRDDIEELIGITETVRGLEFLRDPIVTIVTDEELASRVRALIAEDLDPEEVAQEETLMRALGILDAGQDLATLYLDLYAEQVAGYYDGDSEEMVVPAGDGELSAMQRLTMVHELTHALTDQHFSFDDKADALSDADAYEAAAAFQALFEGDASWASFVYLQTVMTADEQRAVQEEALDVDTTVLDGTPSYITDPLTFPYDFEGGGGSFVADLWLADRSFAAVDAAYADPPVTTEQIIDPSRYRDREPGAVVTLPGTPIEGYEVVEEGVWGQAGFEALFGEALDPATVSAASRGWGGDSYRLLWDGEHVVFVVGYVGDEPSDGDEMAGAWQSLVEAQIPPDTSTFVGRSGAEVLFVAADALDAAELSERFFPDFR